MPSRHRLLSTNLDQELSAVPLEISKGYIPHWLKGTLIRNGPAKFEISGKRVSHWFDGLAMLHAFSFWRGSVTYTNKFLRTDAYRKVHDEHSWAYLGFASDPCRSLFKRFFTALFPSLTPETHNANINVAKFFDAYVALTETPLPVQFDPSTLQTLGLCNYDDTLPHRNCWESAHPHVDSNTGTIINYLVDFGIHTYYIVYRIDSKTKQRKLLAKIPTQSPSYMHTFSITQRYIVFTEYPFVIHSKIPLLKNRGFIQNYVWEPQRGTTFLILDNKTGAVVCRCKGESFFAFHHVNAYEEEGFILVDIISYPNADIVMDLADYGKGSPEKSLSLPSLIRYKIHLSSGSVTQKTISSIPFELPRINNKYDGNKYSYAYACDPRESFDSAGRNLYKIDLNQGKIWYWSQPGCYPGEPIFVPHPEKNDGGEDGGVVLSVILNDFTGKSFLLILDAQSWQEIGRAEIAHHIPMGLHGQYFN